MFHRAYVFRKRSSRWAHILSVGGVPKIIKRQFLKLHVIIVVQFYSREVQLQSNNVLFVILQCGKVQLHLYQTTYVVTLAYLSHPVNLTPTKRGCPLLAHSILATAVIPWSIATLLTNYHTVVDGWIGWNWLQASKVWRKKQIQQKPKHTEDRRKQQK